MNEAERVAERISMALSELRADLVGEMEESILEAYRMGQERMRERAADEAKLHRERAKEMQQGLLKKRDRFYGVGSVDSIEWDRHQRAAGCAAAIAEAIRVLEPEPLEP